MSEREAVIWCPICQQIKGEVMRVPADNPGVFVNKPVPDPMPKNCDQCRTPLVRRQ
jgi:uncharacterized Zn finger protein (UPF0148 family)